MAQFTPPRSSAKRPVDRHLVKKAQKRYHFWQCHARVEEASGSRRRFRLFACGRGRGRRRGRREDVAPPPLRRIQPAQALSAQLVRVQSHQVLRATGDLVRRHGSVPEHGQRRGESYGLLTIARRCSRAHIERRLRVRARATACSTATSRLAQRHVNAVPRPHCSRITATRAAAREASRAISTSSAVAAMLHISRVGFSLPLTHLSRGHGQRRRRIVGRLGGGRGCGNRGPGGPVTDAPER